MLENYFDLEELIEIKIFDIILENADDQRAHLHHPENGSLFVMAHNATSDLTYCKVDLPFSQVDLHITIPPNPKYKDVLT